MKFQGIDLEETIANAKEALSSDKNIASSTKAVFNVLLMLVSILANQMGLNSKNSSIPPSQDPNRKKDQIPIAVKIRAVKKAIKA